jgi:dipeptidyl-peptidase-4
VAEDFDLMIVNFNIFIASLTVTKTMKIIRSILPFAFLLVSFLTSFGQPQITLENIIKEGRFVPKDVSGIVSMNDGTHYTILEDDNIVAKYIYADGKKSEELFSLANNPIKGNTSISSYELSRDEQRILLTGDREYIYRHSFVAFNFIYDLPTKMIIPVSDKKQQLAKLSPDGNYVAFVCGNNLFIKDLNTLLTRQITFDGKHGEIINGMPDWVYEEEFTLTSGFDWSPDSKNLAFFRFDESKVKEFQIEEYKDLYPDRYSYKYPKAGEANSVVTINLFSLESNTTQTMETGKETDVYYPRIKWTSNPNQLCVVRLNRLQNKADLLLCDASSGKSGVFYTESDKKFISEFTDDFANFLSTSNEVIILSGKDGFMHLYRYSLDGKPINQITSGNWEVDKILGIDETNKAIYYTSTEISPLQRHIYKISFDGKHKVKLSTEKGCNDAEFSSTFEYYIESNSSANEPLTVSLFDKNGKLIRILEDNAELKNTVQEFKFSNQEFFQLKGPENYSLSGYIIRPFDFDSTKKYPLFIYVYGGPESQEVLDEWNRQQAWFQLLAQHGYIVACIDNRGTDGRGEEFKKLTYMQLGKYETEDQIAAANYLGSLPYIDKSRIGIFGWSYGGYMSLLCLMNGNGLFKMGIAVAPVTNWRFYDSAYTERFMRKPQDNPNGYDDNSPLNNVQGLKGKLLLVHGSADDNVHFQNSMMLVDELVRQNKQFEMQVYPNKNHGIFGGNTRFHLYTRMTNFIFENL